MSAIIPEDGDVKPEVAKVLVCLYPGFDTMDAVGPLEILSYAQHDPVDPSEYRPQLSHASVLTCIDSKAFTCIFAGQEEYIVSRQGASFRTQIDYKEALKRLPEVDILIIPGGDYDSVIKSNSEPLQVIKAYADLQQKNPSRERTLFSVCTGSFLLAHQGILSGQCATTHPDFYTKFENVCKSVTARDLSERTDVLEERYVVNNPRFDLGDEDENPYIRARGERRPSNARKGSNSWRESNKRRESNARRMSLKLGGLRVITSGGITTGLDAALYLVSAMVSHESANEVARIMQYEWKKGCVVRGVDV